jgi:hypothetical protein
MSDEANKSNHVRLVGGIAGMGSGQYFHVLVLVGFSHPIHGQG